MQKTTLIFLVAISFGCTNCSNNQNNDDIDKNQQVGYTEYTVDSIGHTSLDIDEDSWWIDEQFEGTDGTLLDIKFHAPTNITERLPFIIYFHDDPATMDGNDGEVLNRLMTYMINEEQEAHVMVPVLPATTNWTDALMETVYELVESYKEEDTVNSRRVYATGFGKGANFLWKMALAYPTTFSSIAPVCGGPERDDVYTIPEVPDTIKGLNIFVINVKDDRTVNNTFTKELMIQLFSKNADNTHYSERMYGGHSTRYIYDSISFWDWMFNSRRIE